MRVSELCGLDLGDVDEGRRLLRVIGKGDRERRVPTAFRRSRRSNAGCADGRPAAAHRSQLPAPCCSECGDAGSTPVPPARWYMSGQNGHRECLIWLHMGYDTAQRLTCWSAVPT